MYDMANEPARARSIASALRPYTSLDPAAAEDANLAADISMGFLPVIGTAQAGRDFERARREGSKLGMGLAAVGALPIVGGAVKPAKKLAAALRKGKSKGKKRAPMGTLFDEVTDPAEALAMALRGKHLQRAPDGSYIGGPPGMNSPQALARTRRYADQLVDEGEFGMDWYDRARRTAERFSPPGRTDMQSLFPRAGAAYSPQAQPTSEVGAQIMQHNARVLRGEDVRPRTGSQMRNVARAYEDFDQTGRFEPQALTLGRKTGPYADAKDPTVDPATLYKTANDIWHGRAMGWGPDFDRGFTPTEHNYLTGENLLLAERAKARDAAAGVERASEWTPRSGQAATWTALRKREFIDKELAAIAKQNATRKGPPIEPDMADITRRAERYAAGGIDDAVQRHSAYVTSEARTGADVGHLPMEDPALIETYTDLVRDRTAGRDPVADALSLYSAESVPTRGFYPNSMGEVERNPGWQNQWLVATEGGAEGLPRTADADTAALDFSALTGAVLRGQEAGAHSRVIPQTFGAQKIGDVNAMLIEHGGDPARRAQVEQAAQSLGVGPVDYGDRAMLTRFMDDDPSLGRAPGQGELFTRPQEGAFREQPLSHEAELLSKALREQGVDDFYVTPGRRSSGYEETFLGRGNTPQGDLFADTAADAPAQTTRNLLARSEQISQQVPGIEARTAGAISEQARAMNEIDAAIGAASGLPQRQDLIKLRDVLGQGGIPALRDFVAKHGYAGLPAGLLAVVGLGAMSEQDQDPALGS